MRYDRKKIRVKLQAPLVSQRVGECTPLSHVFPRTVRGAFCYCEQRRWGIEPVLRNSMQTDAHGHVRRRVWKCLVRSKPTKQRPYWVYVLAMRGCGHLVQRTSDAPVVWTTVRCRMCESRFLEIEERNQRAQVRQSKRRAREKRLQEKLWRRQQQAVLRVRIGKAGRKVDRGTGVIRIRLSKTRRSGRGTRG